MQIVIGRVVGAEFKSGTSGKTGKSYTIFNIFISGLVNSVFDGVPQKISVPAEKADSVRAKLLSMKPGERDEICCTVQNQPRSDGPDQIQFLDFFTMPNATAK